MAQNTKERGHFQNQISTPLATRLHLPLGQPPQVFTLRLPEQQRDSGTGDRRASSISFQRPLSVSTNMTEADVFIRGYRVGQSNEIKQFLLDKTHSRRQRIASWGLCPWSNRNIRT
jgi:hypothetical protein